MSTIGHFTVGRDMHAKCTTKSFSAPDGILWTMTYICSAIGNKLCFPSFAGFVMSYEITFIVVRMLIL